MTRIRWANAAAFAMLTVCTPALAQVSVSIDSVPDTVQVGDAIEVRWTVSSPDPVFTVLLHGDDPASITEVGRVFDGGAGSFVDTVLATRPGTLEVAVYVRSGQTRGRTQPRTVTVLPAQQQVAPGAIETILGDGSSDPLPGASFPSAGSMGGRSWGVAVSNAGDIYCGLFDVGAIARLEADGTATVVVDGLDRPMVFDFAPNDDLLIADQGSDRLLLATAASGYSDVRTILGPQTLSQPGAARYGANGKVYVADTGNHRVIELEADFSAGRVVAGGTQGLAGDGGVATRARLNFPIDVDVDARGALVIADAINNRLRGVNLNAQGVLEIAGVRVAAGQIETLAGSGPAGAVTTARLGDSDARGGFSGDGGPALRAGIDWPFAPRFDRTGGVWFLDADNHRLRRIAADGTIATVAGGSPLPQTNGSRGVGSAGRDVGDGGAAEGADLNHPMDLELLEEGGRVTLLIGDTDNARVRRIAGVTPPVPPADTQPPSFAGVVDARAQGMDGLALRWGAAADGRTPVGQIRYRVYLATASRGQDFSTPTVETSPGALQVTLGGLDADTRYFAVVRAVDALGNEDANTRELAARTDPLPQSRAPTFREVQAVFAASCTGCHSVGGPAPFSLEPGVAFGNLVNAPAQQLSSMPRITPGNLDRSYLWHKIQGTHQQVGGRGRRMPIGPPLSAAQIGTIRGWIEAGARN